MQDLRPLLPLFLAWCTGCPEPPRRSTRSGVPPAVTAPPEAAPAPTSTPDGKTVPTSAEGTETTTGTKATGADQTDIPRLNADKVRLMVPKRLVFEPAGDDETGTEKTCMIRFVIGPTGEPTVAEPLGCDENYVDKIQSHAMGWTISPADGVSLPELSEVLWEIRYSVE